MKEYIVSVGLGITIFIGVVTWLAMMLASLPGAELDNSLRMKTVRFLFYIHPFFVALSWYFLNKYTQENYISLLWCLAPLISVFIVWLIFSFSGIERQ